MAYRSHTEHPPERRPILVWDGECGFCRKSVERILYQVGDTIDAETYQETADRFSDIPVEDFRKAAHFIEPNGRVTAGPGAIFRARATANGGRIRLWCYENVPLFDKLCWLVYRAVAGHRRLVSRTMRHLVGPDLLPRQYRLTRWIFLRLLGITALIAFVSLWSQMSGLFGADGILPAGDFMARRADSSLWELPTLTWLGASNAWLHAIAAVGTLCCLLIIFDVVPLLGLFGAWLCYLSLTIAGGVFFWFQWDSLLLETLLLAMLVAPWRLRPQLETDREPPLSAVWLIRLLVFKLMFLAGIVKLLADDPSWENLTALEYHFFTQPLPTDTAFIAHNLPPWMLSAMTFVMFVIELGLPFLLFLARRGRLVFFWGTALLMITISATGNYGFFNLLTLTAAIMLLDDSAIRRLMPKRWRKRTPDPTTPPRRAHVVRRWVILGLAAPILLLSFLRSLQRTSPTSVPEWGNTIIAETRQFRSINSYGLFAGMTKRRPEIVVQGSHDRVIWKTYEFKWKPTSLQRTPEATGPHMPRLDWQMWFAGIYGCNRSVWFHHFQMRLLEGKQDVRDLLETDPFPDEPPRFIRSIVYDYEFNSWSELRDSGNVWKRTRRGYFCATAARREGQIGWLRPLPLGPDTL